MTNLPDEWYVENDGQRLVLDYSRIENLIEAARLCHYEMRHTVAPRNSFTDALDALDAALLRSP